jgi:Spy/CpxP family protein refolding chaperone
MVMKRWQLFLFAFVCFTVGALSATVYESVAQDGRVKTRRDLYSGLADKLKLSETQQDRLHEIVEEARHQMVALSQKTKPRFRSIKNETRDRIRGILDGEQLSKFDAICDSCDRRKSGRR